MEKPKIDDELTLLKDDIEVEAFCTEVIDDPENPDGVVLKVMVRAPFEEGEQCWLIGADGSKIGATVEAVSSQHTLDTEVMLAAIIPREEGESQRIP